MISVGSDILRIERIGAVGRRRIAPGFADERDYRAAFALLAAERRFPIEQVLCNLGPFGDCVPYA